MSVASVGLWLTALLIPRLTNYNYIIASDDSLITRYVMQLHATQSQFGSVLYRKGLNFKYHLGTPLQGHFIISNKIVHVDVECNTMKQPVRHSILVTSVYCN